MQIKNFFAMGEYSAYIWAAYGATLGVFGINVLKSLYEHYKVKQFIIHYCKNHSDLNE